MALAERLLGQEFNRAGHNIVDHRTWCFVGDGCLMEGISHEACSLAGVLGLEKLIVLYDDNGISIDGHVEGWFADDTPARFEAYGWRVVRDVDGHNPADIESAIRTAKTPCGKPTLICCKTIIGWGSPNQAGTHDVHGAALGAKEAAATKAALGWDGEAFAVPEAVRAAWDGHATGAARQHEWQAASDAYAAAFPTEAAEFNRRTKGDLPADFATRADAFIAAAENADTALASRKSSQQAIEALAGMLPEFFGGSADLTGSNFTNWKACVDVHGATGAGNYIHYGVREFGMAAIMNGVALHGGYIPSGGTFLVFSDYARNALRLAALMSLRSIFVLTHDSIGVGEDGPTHQPVEHVASLRLIPNLDVWRPCDTLETSVAWRAAIERHGPAALILSRQNLEQHPGIAGRGAAAARGGYVLADAEGPAQVTIIATGSEVALATGARALLAAKGIAARVVSMPSMDVFLRQDAAWRDSVLPHGVPRVAVEAGVSDIWFRFVGLEGAVVGMDRFGESAPAGTLYKHFGLTAEAVAQAAENVIK
jgi:transketolase